MYENVKCTLFKFVSVTQTVYPVIGNMDSPILNILSLTFWTNLHYCRH